MAPSHGVNSTASDVSVSNLAIAAAAVPGVYKRILPQTIIGANEKIRTGHIGLFGCLVSGLRDLQYLLMRDDIQPIAVSDLYPRSMDQATQIIERKYAAPVKTTRFEELIANKDIDAVIIATPDHLHTVPTLMAIDAGKDVYCARPLCVTIEEAIAVRDKVNSSKQIYQSGTVQRSGAYFQEAVELIHKGYIGRVGRVECWKHTESYTPGPGTPTDAKPDWLDWDRYVAWTPRVAYNKNRYSYLAPLFTDYSGGAITEWGTDLLDIAIWAMGQEKSPRKITAASAKRIITDNRTTPDTLDVFWEFDDYILSFSNRVWNPDWLEDSLQHGILFHGTLGSMRVDRKGYKVYPFRANGGCEKVEKHDASEGAMNTAHWENFAQCIRSRQAPVCNIDVAFHTALICLTGKCSYLANAKLDWDANTLKFTGHDSDAVNLANEWAYRPYQNGWSLKPPYLPQPKA